MIQHPDLVEQMRAVTISREYGSGGGEVARHMAQRLGWRLVDHEIVVRVAQTLGVSESEAEAHDEHVEGFVSRLLRSMQRVDPNLMSGATVLPVSAETEQSEYQKALADVVQAAITDGRTVIVGRGSQALLAERRDVLHVRVVAPLAFRVAYVMQREGLSKDDAQARIQLKDRNRMRYLQSAHNLQSDDPHLYDIVVNSAVLDLDSIASLIITALEEKAKRLSVPVEQLGPASGLARYPGRPGDLRPPVTR
ncbi:MAG: cytidylate kinase-like family protein [Ktedonobacteraceae bacterium]